MVQRNLADNAQKVHYIGFLTGKQLKRADQWIKDAVYKHWDTSPAAPPKNRPAEESVAETQPNLQLLAWVNGSPVWPAALTTRFVQGSEEHRLMSEKQLEFEKAFPTATPIAASGTSEPGRTGGLCDYSVDGGECPLDPTRELSLSVVTAEQFQESRPEDLRCECFNMF